MAVSSAPLSAVMRPEVILNSSEKIGQISDAARERAQALYESSSQTLEDIGSSLGLSPAAFRKARQLWNWPSRPRPQRRTGAVADAPVKAETLRMRLEQQLRRELEAVEAMLAQDPAGVLPATAAEKRARTIGSLVRSLNELRRLDPPDGETGNDDFPVSLDELRTQLAQRLDQLRSRRQSD